MAGAYFGEKSEFPSRHAELGKPVIPVGCSGSMLGRKWGLDEAVGPPHDDGGCISGRGEVEA